MATDKEPDLLRGLPRTRPARRSDKRPAEPAVPSAAQTRPDPPDREREPIAAAVRAAAEAAEIGLGLGARVLRGVVARLPKP